MNVYVSLSDNIMGIYYFSFFIAEEKLCEELQSILSCLMQIVNLSGDT